MKSFSLARFVPLFVLALATVSGGHTATLTRKNAAAKAPTTSGAPRSPQSVPGVAKKSTPVVVATPRPTPDPLAGLPVVPRVSSLSKILDPNASKFPRSSLHDFSSLVEAPAGKHGFLQRRGEHFYWGNGQRARFWGINVANSSLQESDADIARMVQNFRAAGFNLIRLHHFDERMGIIDLTKPDSRHFDAARLRKLDYWVYQAKKNGLYIYLDLLDYRRFKEGDGVLNAEAIGRAARPYNVFDKRLIELQKEYARMLLRDHINPYTRLAYADDPVVVMLEIYDESGLFMRRGVWREMPDPYKANFQKLWNDWLQAQYGTTEALRTAWGPGVLDAGESLEQGTVEVPAMGHLAQVPANQKRWADMARRNDGARFADTIHQNYFREMKSYLKSIGVRIPISVTGRFEDIADARGMSRDLDFIASNFYYDHPYWGTGKRAWVPPSYYHNRHPLRHYTEKSFAATVALGRVKGSPFVIREWNYCWPNNARAVGMIEAAAYASLQDIDALILFVYETVPSPRVHYFNVRSDPARWGLAGVAAQVYLKQLVQPAKNRVVVPYNEVDTFHYTEYSSQLYSLAWNTRVENDFYSGDTYRAGADTSLILPPGRSGVGIFEGAPAVLWTNSLRRDWHENTAASPQYLDEYALTVQAERVNLLYSGVLYPKGTTYNRNLPLGLPLPLLQLLRRTPIGVDAEKGIAQGFVDPAKKRLVFGNLDETETVLAARAALRRFGLGKSLGTWNHVPLAFSDTGQMMRDARFAHLAVRSPQFQAICGDVTSLNKTPYARGMEVKVAGAEGGVLVALSLDGQPLGKSKRYMLKMVTDARNLDEDSARDPRFLRQKEGQWWVQKLGQGPVTTLGQPSTKPVSVSVAGRKIVEVYAKGGVWELQVDGKAHQFYCDVPGARYQIAP